MGEERENDEEERGERGLSWAEGGRRRLDWSLVLLPFCYRYGKAYFVGLFVALIGVIILIVIWEIIDLRSRKCENPNCQGLRRAVEFDIQLESEDCIKCLPSDRDLNSSSFYDYGVKPLELGEERKELEAELKRMAPRNGRTVLIFRAPCGCPAGRLEVWGNKKIRRIKNK
uniref:Uncharacterized protein At5g19025-like n=1 Tax=Nicotiana sylvestris TaxID=4096 RepID=A0A1U7X2S4_NICSY|nr:PREDICTED: uncharacterized protein At5g19025-like [Nicotiana sylvestris]